jgi:phospholipase/lecithinase/hemolysin
MVETAAASMRTIVADLARQGATDILVPDLPGIGIAPAVRAQGSQAVAAADRRAGHFNSALDHALSTVAATPGLRLYRLDVRQLAKPVRTDPAAAEFTNVTTSCGQRRDCEGHLF